MWINLIYHFVHYMYIPKLHMVLVVRFSCLGDCRFLKWLRAQCGGGNNYVANLIHLNSTENACSLYNLQSWLGCYYAYYVSRCEDSFGVDDILRCMVYITGYLLIDAYKC